MSFLKPNGDCDAGCSKPAIYWYGRTNRRYCDSPECKKEMDRQYEEHCKELTLQIQLDDDDGY